MDVPWMCRQNMATCEGRHGFQIVLTLQGLPLEVFFPFDLMGKNLESGAADPIQSLLGLNFSSLAPWQWTCLMLKGN